MHSIEHAITRSPSILGTTEGGQQGSASDVRAESMASSAITLFPIPSLICQGIPHPALSCHCLLHTIVLSHHLPLGFCDLLPGHSASSLVPTQLKSPGHYQTPLPEEDFSHSPGLNSYLLLSSRSTCVLCSWWLPLSCQVLVSLLCIYCLRLSHTHGNASSTRVRGLLSVQGAALTRGLNQWLTHNRYELAGEVKERITPIPASPYLVNRVLSLPPPLVPSLFNFWGLRVIFRICKADRVSDAPSWLIAENSSPDSDIDTAPLHHSLEWRENWLIHSHTQLNQCLDSNCFHGRTGLLLQWIGDKHPLRCQSSHKIPCFCYFA